MPTVDVLLVCYNQEGFIERTLRSVLAQRTTFDYRVVVADDCSKDGTIDIIKRMEQESGKEFVYLDRSTNLGISANYFRSFNACDSKYVAVMEGDDLWIDEYRLQKHIDFLEAHEDYVMSFNKLVVVNSDNESHVQPNFEDEDYDLGYHTVDGNILAESNVIGNFSACVYRTECLKKIDREIFMNGYDWIVNLKMSQFGKICCFLQPQSVYRLHSNGVWSRMSHADQLRDVIEAIERYDKLTDYQYSESFRKHSYKLKAELCAVERGEISGDQKRSPFSVVMNELRAFVSRLIAFVQK
ncbi:MAG: glycosyltransferase [Candidatus Methanomethylophilaceae archaeon]|nr:glycosyltransferase [Candidatus Methanomethylophilaceae archaeon]